MKNGFIYKCTMMNGEIIIGKVLSVGPEFVTLWIEKTPMMSSVEPKGEVAISIAQLSHAEKID